MLRGLGRRTGVHHGADGGGRYQRDAGGGHGGSRHGLLRRPSEPGRHDRVRGRRLRYRHTVRTLRRGPAARLRRRLLPTQVHRRSTG